MRSVKNLSNLFPPFLEKNNTTLYICLFTFHIMLPFLYTVWRFSQSQDDIQARVLPYIYSHLSVPSTLEIEKQVFPEI